MTTLFSQAPHASLWCAASTQGVNALSKECERLHETMRRWVQQMLEGNRTVLCGAAGYVIPESTSYPENAYKIHAAAKGHSGAVFVTPVSTAQPQHLLEAAWTTRGGRGNGPTGARGTGALAWARCPGSMSNIAALRN